MTVRSLFAMEQFLSDGRNRNGAGFSLLEGGSAYLKEVASGPVTESIVIRHVLRMFNGDSGSIFCWSASGEQAYAINNNLQVEHLRGKSFHHLLAPLLRGASSLRRLVKFTDTVQLNTIASCSGDGTRAPCPTVEAYAQAVLTEIQGFRNSVKMLEDRENRNAGSFTLLRLSTFLGRQCEELEFLEEVTKSAAPWAWQGSLTTKPCSHQSAYLLTTLYNKLDTISDQQKNQTGRILLVLWAASMLPMLMTLEAWLNDGKLHDPAEEFFVCANRSTVVGNPTFWRSGYCLRSNNAEQKTPLSSSKSMKVSSATSMVDFASFGGASQGPHSGQGSAVEGCPAFLQDYAKAIWTVGNSRLLLHHAQGTLSSLGREDEMDSSVVRRAFKSASAKMEDTSQDASTCLKGNAKCKEDFQPNLMIHFCSSMHAMVKDAKEKLELEKESFSASGNHPSSEQVGQVWSSPHMTGLVNLFLPEANESFLDAPSNSGRVWARSSRHPSDDSALNMVERPGCVVGEYEASAGVEHSLWKTRPFDGEIRRLEFSKLAGCLDTAYSTFWEELSTELLGLDVGGRGAKDWTDTHRCALPGQDIVVSRAARQAWVTCFDEEPELQFYGKETLLSKRGMLTPEPWAEHDSLLLWLRTADIRAIPEPALLLRDCVLNHIDYQVKSVGAQLVELLTERWGLQSQLASLRDVFFRLSGNHFDPFLSVLSTAHRSVRTLDLNLLHRALEESVENVEDSRVRKVLASLQLSSHVARLNTARAVEGNTGAGPAGVSGLKLLQSYDNLRFTWQADWPLEMVVDPSAQHEYSQILQFLIKVTWVKKTMDEAAYRILKARGTWEKASAKRPKAELCKLVLRLQERLVHFMNTLFYYVVDEVSLQSWTELTSAMAAAESLESLIACHRAYLAAILHSIFANSGSLTEHVASLVQKLLGLVLDFCMISDKMMDVCERDPHLLRTYEGQWHEQLLKLGENAKQRLTYFVQVLSTTASGSSHFKDFVSHLDFNDYFRCSVARIPR